MSSAEVTASSLVPCRVSMLVTDVDPDYLRLDVSVADGEFAGRADIFESLDLPETLAAKLQGFPRTPDDRREIVLGSFDPRIAGGGIRLLFRCIDRAGHAILEGELEDRPMDGTPQRSVLVRVPISAPAIDQFVSQLRQWKPSVGDQQTLPGAG